ncbi:alpha/beta fold hydrolase [Micromonospora sp. CPCC 206061]|uniref:alpha/beta fold hydrolase n=1 Tax=Micromonospora sp. CPCC 206061 TaxID=3122410 RepID=UPI002FF14E5A
MTAPVAHPLRPETGSGPLVAFVHGIQDTWGTWQVLAERLPESWRLVAFDMPWGTDSGHRWRREANSGGWLRRALDGLPDPVDVLVGHSLGASAVLETLASGKPPLRAATLLAPQYRPAGWRVDWELFDTFRDRLQGVVREQLRRRLLARGGRTDEAAIESRLDKMIDRIGPMYVLALFDEFIASGDLALSTVSVPTLIMSGLDDDSLTHGRVDVLSQELPRATILREPTLSHMCHIDQAGLVAAYLSAFVSQACPDLAPIREERPC